MGPKGPNTTTTISKHYHNFRVTDTRHNTGLAKEDISFGIQEV